MIPNYSHTGLNKICLYKYFLNVQFEFGCKATLICCGELNTDVKLCVYLSVSGGERSGKEHLLYL